MAPTRYFSALLALLLCVLAFMHSRADTSVAHNTHNRRLTPTATADDADAACAAAAANSPFATYLTAIPTTSGLRSCAAAHLPSILATVSAKDSLCPLTTLTTLLSSTTTNATNANTDMAAFQELVGALVSGVAPPATLQSFLTSWTAPNSRKTAQFCSAMTQTIAPCVQTLVPLVFSLLRKRNACCREFNDFVDVLALITPPDTSIDQHSLEVVNGFYTTLCTTVSDGHCATPLFRFLSRTIGSPVSATSSLLSALLVDGGVPLYLLPDANVCSALERPSFTARNTATLEYYAPACCAVPFAAFLALMDASLLRVSGNSFAEVANVIVAESPEAAVGPSLTGFRSFYTEIKACQFTGAQCAAPAIVLSTAVAGVEPMKPDAQAIVAKTATSQRVVCIKTTLCDATNVCSSVCQAGSVRIAPTAARALAYQRNVTYRHALCDAQLLGTHNSATTSARGYGNRDQLVNSVLNVTQPQSFVRTNNQFLSLTDQLGIGARFLEIDVHFVGGALRSGHCSRVGFALIDDIAAVLQAKLATVMTTTTTPTPAIEYDASVFGCVPSLSGIRASDLQLHTESLSEVTNWLDSHPSELVVLYTEVGSDVQTFQKEPALLQLYDTAFRNRLFRPADLDARGGEWSFPLSDLIAADKRVIVVTTSTPNKVMFDLSSLCKRSFTRAYSSALQYATFTEAALRQIGTTNRPSRTTAVTPATIPQFVTQGINVIAPDGLDGAAAEAMIWSWALNEPSLTGASIRVVVSANDSRWYSVDATTIIPYAACVDVTNTSQWELVATDATCAKGFVARPPHTAVENVALVTAMQAQRATFAAIAVDLTTFPVVSTSEVQAFETAVQAGGDVGRGDGSGAKAPVAVKSTASSSNRRASFAVKVGATFAIAWVVAAAGAA